MNRTVVLLALSLLALPSAANAQTTRGAYLSVAAGMNKMPQEDMDAVIAGSGTDAVFGEVLTSAGPALVGSAGLGLGHGLRVEVEGAYRANHISGEIGLDNDSHASGTERKSGVMGNVLYEFGGARVRPYFGGGIGSQFAHEPGANTSSGGVSVTIPAQTKASFAYQGIAGAAFPVQRARGLSITAEYRYLALAGTRTYTGTATIPGVGSFPLSDESTSDVNHSVLFGIRYGFGG